MSWHGIRTTFFFLGLMVLASCGGGGGGGGGTTTDPNAPIISELEIRPLDPERINQNIRYVVAFRVVDGDGDIIGGQCEVLLNGQSIGRATINPIAGTPTNTTSGAIGCAFVVRVGAPQTVNGGVRVFDRAGRQSNELSFLLGIHAQVPHGIPEGAKGTIEGQMEWSTVR